MENEKRELRININALKDEKTQHLAQANEIFEAVKPLISALNQEHATKWEYLALKDPDSEELDKAGQMGWELVGISSYETGADGRMTVHMQYIFKRPTVAESEYPESIVKKYQPALELLERIKEINQEIEELSSKHDSM